MPETVESKIDDVIVRRNRAGLDSSIAAIYTEGIKFKLKASRYCLYQIKRLEFQPDTPAANTGATGVPAPIFITRLEELAIYTEHFWNSMRSCFDLIGQLINITESLGKDEKNIDIKQIYQAIKTPPISNPQLVKALQESLDNLYFKDLESYRHCISHRRPICIQTYTTQTVVSQTAGYYVSGSTAAPARVERYLCINPSSLAPRIIRGKRPIGKYCDSMYERLEFRVSRIIGQLR